MSKTPQLWKENKAGQEEVRDSADSSHFTCERHQNRGEGYGCIKKPGKGVDLRFQPSPGSCVPTAQAVTAAGSSTVQRCSFTLGDHVLISLLSSWLKIERRAAHRENRVLILSSHSRDSREDPQGTSSSLPDSLRQTWPGHRLAESAAAHCKISKASPKAQVWVLLQEQPMLGL